MALFSLTAGPVILRGTATADTFNFIASGSSVVYGEGGADQFIGHTLESLLDGGVGGNSFNFDKSDRNALLGGDDGDSLFMTGGLSNFMSGGAGEDWIGVGGSLDATTAAKYNSLFGGDGNDFIAATGNLNTLLGGAGNDTLLAYGGNALLGGAGNDKIQAADNANVAAGGAGDDSLFLQYGQMNFFDGGAGNDWLGMNGNNHVLLGGAGDDFLAVTGVQEYLAGGAGNDALNATGGAGQSFNRIFGGDGNDTVPIFGITGHNVTLFGGNGDDFLACPIFDSVIDGGPGNDTMGSGEYTGLTSYNDRYVFLPGYGHDTISGMTSGDNVLLQGFGLLNFAQLQPFMTVSTQLQGGLHIYVATITLGGDVLTILGNGDTPLANQFIFDVALPVPVVAHFTLQRFTGSADNIAMVGSMGNTIYGAEGNDAFSGQAFFSTLNGGTGGDTFTFNLSNNNALLGGDDNAGDSMYITGGTLNYLSGQGGNDWLGVGSSGMTNSTNNTLDGGDGDDSVNASGFQNTLVGGAGNDSLVAVGDQDSLFGDGAGASNTLVGGDGNDTVYLQAGQRSVLDGSDGNDWVGGNGDSTTLIGGNGDDWLGITGVYNRLDGDGGNDTVYAVGGRNMLFGSDGNDWVGVSGFVCRLFGGAGDDYLAASGAQNYLDGGTGNDSLVTGPHSSDVFIFHPGYGKDDITGYLLQDDGIDLGGFGLTFATVMTFAAQVGGDTVFTFGADVLTLHNVQKSALQANDFLL